MRGCKNGNKWYIGRNMSLGRTSVSSDWNATSGTNLRNGGRASMVGEGMGLMARIMAIWYHSKSMTSFPPTFD